MKTDTLKLDIALDSRYRLRSRFVHYIALGVQDFKDTVGRSGRLGHLGNNHTKLGQRKKDESQVKAKLLPLAESQGPVDNLSTAGVQHHRLTEVGNQEYQRKEKG